MTKPQITLIITSVIFVVLIFQLPKVIIKNDKQLKSSTQTAQNTSGSAPVAPDEHTKSVNKEDLEKIEVLRKNYYSFSNKEKKLKFADSISRLYLKAMVFDSAAKFSAEVAALDPKPETWEKAGDAYNQAAIVAGDAEKADFSAKSRSFYEKILENNPKSYDVKAKMAMTYVGGPEPMKGITMLREILKDSPDNEAAIFDLGILSLQSGQHEKAISRFNDLLKINPNHTAGLIYMGVAQYEMGKRSEAKQYFEKAKMLNTDPVFASTIDSYLKELK
jgi:tetratricopeptide (TPR) repeat protein